MELRDRLEICRKCVHKKLVENGPMVCALTNEIPSFEAVCDSYVKDENEPEIMLDDSDVLTYEQIREKATPRLFEKLDKDQDIIKGAVAGLVACIISAILWAVITYIINVQFGYMALGVGAFVAYSVKRFGKGISMRFAIMSSAIAVLGIILGNVLTLVAFASKENDISVFRILFNLDLVAVFKALVETFHPVDILFYGLAISWGFKQSLLKFTAKSLWLLGKDLDKQTT
ncbi:MAG: hypothetical protein U0X39_11750 [Bacteroidales bacterium]